MYLFCLSFVNSIDSLIDTLIQYRPDSPQPIIDYSIEDKLLDKEPGVWEYLIHSKIQLGDLRG